MKRCNTTVIEPTPSDASAEDTKSQYYTCDTAESTSGSLPLTKQETISYSSSVPIGVATKRPADESPKLERKLSKIDTIPMLALQSTTPLPSASSSATMIRAKHLYEPELPDWRAHTDAWAFMQSLNPEYESKYLTRQSPVGNSSTGYVFGRRPACDFMFTQNEISKKHCAIHMERGCTSNQESGLSIYLEDFSSNGTFINGVRVGPMKRVLLRTGDRIQLYRRDSYSDDDERHLFYRILLPPHFEVSEFHSMYRVGRTLGKGNFATVYKAYNRNETPEGSQPRYVAVKSIKKSKLDRRPRLLPSVIQEIGILMSLEAHPCVIKIEKVFDEPRYIYLVLEYVRGGDLFDLVTKNGSLSESETRFIFFQLFAGIKFLHERQVAHRDLKPENDAEKLQIKITDFGLAKATSTKQNVLDSQCGTPNYVAPEILDPTGLRAYTKSCDLWSLGVILYICLSGMPPFSEEMTLPGMKERIRSGLYSYDYPCFDNVSPEAKDLINRLLTVDPVKRIDVDGARTHAWFMNGLEELRTKVQDLDDGSKELLQYYESMPSVPATQLTTQII